MRILSLLFCLALVQSGLLAAPTVTRIIPPPESTNHALLSIEVFFDQAVTNVDASDLLINEAPATELSFGVPGQYLFEFPSPATGIVYVTWAPDHGITDLAGEPFGGEGWSYVLDPNAPTAALLLNEFMADNDNTLNDEDGDNEDWIEIHNPGAVEVDIGGWFLTDDPARLNKWRFPEGKTIPANGYLVVFASNKNRTNLLGQLHANFALNNDGEYVALVDRNMNVVSDFPLPVPRQFADISYGRVPGNPTVRGYFSQPTPGGPNQSGGDGFAPEVNFSRPSGTFLRNAPFNLSLTAPLSNAVIRYAFGTNVPGTNSAIYIGPLPIAATTMIRARAFAPGLLPGPVTTHTYVALDTTPDVISFTSSLPVMILHNYGQGAVPVSKAEQYVIVQTFEPAFGYTSLTNPAAHTEFGIFHVRGSSTAVGSQSGKASFFLEVQDEFRNDKEVPLLGLPEESDWVLYAPNRFEPVLFHNPLAFDLARDLGEYASRYKFFEVYLKDDAGAPGPITASDYYGVFVLEEKIKRDNNRTDIAPLEREHATVPSVTGGYMWSVDRSAPGEQLLSAGGATLNWIEPNGIEIANPARHPQRVYVTNYLNQFRNTLTNNVTWTNPVTGYQAYIDRDSWVRRHIHEVVTHNVDALRLSGFFFKDRNKRIEYGPAWDYDRTQGSTDGRDFNPRVFRSRIPDLGTDYFNPQSNGVQWWGRLFTDPDFWQLWIDKYQEYREGPFSLSNVAARIENLAAQLRPVHARETNRWNIRPRSGNVTTDGFTHNFGPTVSYENEVRWKAVWYSNRLDFIDTNFLARPSLSVAPGAVSNGQAVVITPATKPGTTLFYTLDGTDPRLPSGGISPAAFSNDGPVELTLTNNALLMARSWNPGHSNLTGAHNPPISSPWSGLRTGTFFTHVPALRITEIMYHPQQADYTNDVNFEFLEVKNIGATPLDLNGFTLSRGVDFTFGNVTLQPGQAGVIVANQAEFIARYGSGRLILGQYAGDEFGDKTNVLDNAGERLVLRGAAGELILDFKYDDGWYPLTDGFGFSLVIVDENAPTDTWGLKESWRQSGMVDGSPGEDDPSPANVPVVVISEVLTHSKPAPPHNAIELHNLSTNVADISGWFLTDEYDEPKKFRIPDETLLAPGGFVVFEEPHFNDGIRPFTLSSLGGEVYLFSANPFTDSLTGYFQGFDFGAAENGRSFGRHIISTGTDQYPAQLMTTLGASNAGPLIGPVIISEINYRPFDIYIGDFGLDNSIDEYVELQNITSTNVPLYDPNNPFNTWHLREAVEYAFPPWVMLPPGAHLLVVSFDPADAEQAAAFRARNYVPAHIPLYGPYGGKLDNSGEALELRRPDRPEPPGPPRFGLAPSLLVERIRYSDSPPWPTNADGRGLSLQRIASDSYGNDPASWVAAAVSAGGPYEPGPAPEITVQPADTAAYFSHDASFTIQASGANLRYQWLHKGRAIRDGTNSTLMLTYLESQHAGEYAVVVMNSGGSIVSSNAVLTVLTNSATIVAHPQNFTAVAGRPATNIAVVAASMPVTYQWFFNGEEIPGATSSSYLINPVATTNAGVYHLRITDAIASIFTRPATMSVIVPPIFVFQPESIYVPMGSSVTMSLQLNEDVTLPVTNRWRRITGGSINITNVVHSISDFVTFTNITASNLYDVIVFNRALPTGLQRRPPYFIAPLVDTDLDGMPDVWEAEHGFEIGDSQDAALDFDGDGMSNLAEYIAGTDPKDETSYLFVELVEVSGAPAASRLLFMAVSNRTYSVQFRNSLISADRVSLQHISAAPTNRMVEVLDTSPDASSRFYQLVTPRQ